MESGASCLKSKCRTGAQEERVFHGLSELKSSNRARAGERAQMSSQSHESTKPTTIAVLVELECCNNHILPKHNSYCQIENDTVQL